MPTIDGLPRPNGGHPTDGELRAHFDGEAADASIATHVAACAACRSRLARLTEDQRATETLLASLDHPMPARPAPVHTAFTPQRRWLRIAAAAAVVTLCVSGIAAARPGGPLYRLLARVTAVVTPRKTPVPPTAPTRNRNDVTAAPGTVGVAFDPAQDLIVRFPEADHAGTVRVTVTDRSTAAVRVQDGTVAFALVGDTVDIAPHEGTRHYLVTVPRHLARFEIQVGGRLRYAARRNARNDIGVPADTLLTLSSESQGNP